MKVASFSPSAFAVLCCDGRKTEGGNHRPVNAITTSEVATVHQVICSGRGITASLCVAWLMTAVHVARQSSSVLVRARDRYPRVFCARRIDLPADHQTAAHQRHAHVRQASGIPATPVLSSPQTAARGDARAVTTSFPRLSASTGAYHAPAFSALHEGRNKRM